MRNLILVAHRWAGLIIGIVLVIVSLTGAAIAFEGGIDRALNPTLFAGRASSDAVPAIDSLLARARTAAGDERVTGVQLPEAGGRVFVFTTDKGREIFINPETGAVNGTRTPRERDAGLARKLHEMHETLLAGRGGLFVVRIVTALALLTVVGGIYLWWPDKIWHLRKGASWKRVNFDLHHALGIFATIPLVLITASSMLMSWHPLDQAVVKLAGSTPAPRTVQPPPDSAHHAVVSLASAIAAARRQLPEATPTLLSFPADTTAPVTVVLRFPEDHTPAGRSRVALDRWRGTVLSTLSTRDMRLGTRISAMKRAWHTGDLFGWPTLIIWNLASLIMAAQAVTGAIMWWNGRPARKAAAARKATA